MVETEVSLAACAADTSVVVLRCPLQRVALLKGEPSVGKESPRSLVQGVAF